MMKTLLANVAVSKARKGFTLTEMLFAIFILGIGVVSIASLFPVGLTQQQRSADAILGPIVANNALEVLRSKVSPDDFGYSNIFNSAGPFDDVYTTIETDSRWRRPAFYLSDVNNVTDNLGINRDVSAGSIDLFYGTQYSGADAHTVTELTYSKTKFPIVQFPDPPHIVIAQQDRYWPQQPAIRPVGTNAVPPQYVWDCAFRRFQGRIQVAIFVYRVQSVGGEAPPYRVAENPIDNNLPPLPHANLLDGSSTYPDYEWGPDLDPSNPPGTTRDVFFVGTEPGTPYDPYIYDQGWQAPGQWLLDQNNNIHRVLSGRRNSNDGPVELTRPAPAMPPVAVYSFGSDLSFTVIEMWYIPPVTTGFTETGAAIQWNLTPVYIAVREL